MPVAGSRNKDIFQSQEATLKNMARYQKKGMTKQMKQKLGNSGEMHIDNIVNSDAVIKSMHYSLQDGII